MNGLSNSVLEPESNSPIPKKPKPSPITAWEIAAEFSHDDPIIAPVNNNSFDSCPRSILAAQSTWQLKLLS